ncbi:MAG TPA: hypothetical protein VN408_16930, partial [Actinoplanes sp.]|nr:hypothetical protein [Actinoplanes sp.]
MRVFRTILGMLLLTTGLPALLTGGGLWAVTRHGDAYTGELQKLTVPGYAVVVPDFDRLLRDDAPFARLAGSRLLLSAATADGPAFLGLAPSDQVARYLAGVPYNRIDAIDLGTGILPVTTVRQGGRGIPAGTPATRDIWTVKGLGRLGITPGILGDRPHSLVLMNPGGAPVGRLTTIAELTAGWLDTTAWALLGLGSLLLIAGLVILTWPARRRDVVYIVESGRFPELMHALGAPLPDPAHPLISPSPSLPGAVLPSPPGDALPGVVVPGTALPGIAIQLPVGRNGGAHRPRTLADTRRPSAGLPGSRPPALPQFDWPPRRPSSGSPARVVDHQTGTLATDSGHSTDTLSPAAPRPATSFPDLPAGTRGNSPAGTPTTHLDVALAGPAAHPAPGAGTPPAA